MTKVGLDDRHAESLAASLRSAAEDLERSERRLSNEHGRLRAAWVGADATVFAAQVDHRLLGLRQAALRLAELSRTMTRHLEEQRRASAHTTSADADGSPSRHDLSADRLDRTAVTPNVRAALAGLSAREERHRLSISAQDGLSLDLDATVGLLQARDGSWLGSVGGGAAIGIGVGGASAAAGAQVDVAWAARTRDEARATAVEAALVGSGGVGGSAALALADRLDRLPWLQLRERLAAEVASVPAVGPWLHDAVLADGRLDPPHRVEAGLRADARFELADLLPEETVAMPLIRSLTAVGGTAGATLARSADGSMTITLGTELSGRLLSRITGGVAGPSATLPTGTSFTTDGALILDPTGRPSRLLLTETMLDDVDGTAARRVMVFDLTSDSTAARLGASLERLADDPTAALEDAALTLALAPSAVVEQSGTLAHLDGHIEIAGNGGGYEGTILEWNDPVVEHRVGPQPR